jgi:DNA-binding IclR family transcriptional regulator
MTSFSTHRDRVLAALRLCPDPLTVPQLAERCECSPVTVRRALRALRALGLVQFVGNLPRYDARERLAWGRGHGQYAAEPVRAIAS